MGEVLNSIKQFKEMLSLFILTEFEANCDSIHCTMLEVPRLFFTSSSPVLLSLDLIINCAYRTRHNVQLTILPFSWFLYF